MPVTPGTRLGPYEILAPIGAGGMGEVYRARDTRLDRIVAIKVLPAHFADRPDARERFDREARTIASLNHPHICVLHDIGNQDGTDFLVMEYLEGETLAQRLARGPLSLEQVLRYAVEMADALDKAHREGVTHRDLKPGNIILTKTGSKLVDFGLAKLKQDAAPVTPPSGRGSEMATKTDPLTAHGIILGTLPYMAPEQVEGRVEEIDARTDIFAFGAVIYEMATGKKAFEGQSQASLTAAILDRDPPSMSSLQPVTPPLLERAVKKCLAKEPDKRWQSAGDLCDELKWIAEGGGQAAAPILVPRSPWRERAAWIAALSVSIALFFGVRPAAAPTAGDVVRLDVNPPDKTVFTPQATATLGVAQFALSPDGRALVFAAAAPGARPTLWLRSLEVVTAHSLPGTEGPESPFWSPDGRWVGFFADGKLKKIPAAGGPSQVIANVPDARAASWGPDDTILFATGTSGIYRVPSSGGMVTTVTERDASRQEGSHRFPQFLPDGKHFLFTVRSSLTEQNGIYVGSLDGKTKKLLIHGNSSALYASSGHLLFADGETLMGQAFDAERLDLKGQAFVVEGQVGRSSLGTGSFSVSGTGTLAYVGTLSQPSRLTWFDRGGNPSASVGPLGDYSDFRLSPDQRRLAASLVDVKTGLPDIWLMDLARESAAPFTFGPGVNAAPAWSPDGARIIFRTTRKGGITEFYQKSAGGGGKEQPTLLEEASRAAGAQSANLMLWDWSPDGRNLLYSTIPSSDLDLWLLPLAGDPKPVPFLAAPGDQGHGNFSPDGRLVAYDSSESGQFEVHVQTFPISDQQWTVSNNGGYEPRWRADGRELYYLSEDRKLMAVLVGPGPSFGAPRPLFQTRISGGVNQLRAHYVPSRDGQRFLINTPAADPAPTPITVVLNWTAGLKR